MNLELIQTEMEQFILNELKRDKNAYMEDIYKKMEMELDTASFNAEIHLIDSGKLNEYFDVTKVKEGDFPYEAFFNERYRSYNTKKGRK